VAAAILYALLAINALLGRADVAGVSSAPPFLLVDHPDPLASSRLRLPSLRLSGRDIAAVWVLLCLAHSLGTMTEIVLDQNK